MTTVANNTKGAKEILEGYPQVQSQATTQHRRGIRDRPHHWD